MAGTKQPSGKPLNIASSQQIGNILYNWGWTHPDGTAMPPYPVVDTTKMGLPSTADKTLKQFLAYEDRDAEIPTKEAYFIERYGRWKKAKKAKETFLANTRLLSRRDGFLHTSFHINGTGTGRLSSSDMNLQNLPKYLAGWNIKKLFIPSSDEMLICNCDYKGAEVRVFTVYAPDPGLIDAINNGLDMHSYFAAKVYGRPYDHYANRDNNTLFPDKNYHKTLDKERTQIKRVVFGILYGAGKYKIAETVNISVEEAQKLIRLLFDMFKAIEQYGIDIETEVRTNGFVETVFGRRRRFPLHGLSRHQNRAFRQAKNFKIQSTSSDIVMGQLVEVDEHLRHDFHGRMLMTVHDSMVFEFPKKHINQLKDFLTFYGEDSIAKKYSWLPVPFKMDIEVGPSYGEVQSLDSYLREHPFKPTPEGVIEEQEILNELREDAFQAA
jgi:DNA polymerase-1